MEAPPNTRPARNPLTSIIYDRVFRRGEQGFPVANIYFSAHQDDDLIFMSPNLMDDVAAGGVWTVYLTAGDAGLGEKYWLGREEGERVAYTAMGAGRWRDDPLRISNRRIASFTSTGGSRLVFLRLPDGGCLSKEEESSKALERIWYGERIKTVDSSNFYNRKTLVAILVRLIGQVEADIVSTHDPNGYIAGCDHIDHLYTGLFAVEAAKKANVSTRLFRGYSCDLKPQNLPENIYHRKRAVFEEYARYDPIIHSPLDHLYEGWLNRSYLRNPV